MDLPTDMESPPPFVPTVIDGKAQILCLGVVANLEGEVKRVEDTKFSSNKADVHARVCHLEDLYKVTPPPPMQETDWNSLAWRIHRLAKRSERPIPTRFLDKLDFNCLVADPTLITMDKVYDIVASIKPQNFKLAIRADGNIKDEDAEFSRMVQLVCYIAGAHRVRLQFYPTTLRELYAMAAEVAIDVENRPYALLPPPIFPIRPPPPRPPPSGVACTRASCLCACHTYAHISGVPIVNPRSRRRTSISDMSSRSRSSSIIEKPSLLKRVFGLGWLRPLACWKKKKITDDSSSYMYD